MATLAHANQRLRLSRGVTLFAGRVKPTVFRQTHVSFYGQVGTRKTGSLFPCRIIQAGN